jgi:hypothetical protein
MTGKVMVQQRGLDIILPPIILPALRWNRRVRFKHGSTAFLLIFRTLNPFPPRADSRWGQKKGGAWTGCPLFLDLLPSFSVSLFCQASAPQLLPFLWVE